MTLYLLQMKRLYNVGIAVANQMNRIAKQLAAQSFCGKFVGRVAFGIDVIVFLLVLVDKNKIEDYK